MKMNVWEQFTGLAPVMISCNMALSLKHTLFQARRIQQGCSHFNKNELTLIFKEEQKMVLPLYKLNMIALILRKLFKVVVLRCFGHIGYSSAKVQILSYIWGYFQKRKRILKSLNERDWFFRIKPPLSRAFQNLLWKLCWSFNSCSCFFI